MIVFGSRLRGYIGHRRRGVFSSARMREFYCNLQYPRQRTSTVAGGAWSIEPAHLDENGGS
jgi:hypothetical protein